MALSGLFSGLTLGLMSLNPFVLKRKIKLGNSYAKKIYPLRKQGNLLLCTLLLGNVAVNSVLAVFLGSITVGVIAVIVSTGLIVILPGFMVRSMYVQLLVWLMRPFIISILVLEDGPITISKPSKSGCLTSETDLSPETVMV